MRRALASLWWRFFGWNVVGIREFPKKFVFIAAPHTSNWDFPFMIAAAWTLGLRVRWLGKHTLFEGPFGWFFRAFGGIPVDRRAPQGLVHQVIARFTEADEMILGVPPEGTRGKTDYWKSGFYHIAVEAKLPIGLGFLDFGRKRAGIGELFVPTGDIAADMARIRAFYKDIRGKYPDLQCVPRLREEEALDPARTAE